MTRRKPRAIRRKLQDNANVPCEVHMHHVPQGLQDFGAYSAKCTSKLEVTARRNWYVDNTCTGLSEGLTWNKPLTMVGVRQDPQADDTARGRKHGTVYKDVEAQNGKSDSNIASGTIIGAHGSAARLVTVEHNGEPLYTSLISFSLAMIFDGLRCCRNHMAPQQNVPAEPVYSAGVILSSLTAMSTHVL